MYLLHSFYVLHISTKFTLSIFWDLKILLLTCIFYIAFMSYIYQQNLLYQLFWGLRHVSSTQILCPTYINKICLINYFWVKNIMLFYVPHRSTKFAILIIFEFKNIMFDLNLQYSFYVPHISTKIVLSIIFEFGNIIFDLYVMFFLYLVHRFYVPHISTKFALSFFWGV